ncbi:hypothetical protein GUJ93_ZPchr0005g14278 [Zizania palustris]|uniref:Uncharacterized protein n=1 Tax=Zizania palustris TaxID=103762 RepID=A0A8J5SKL7_ZIZPA|nr:hypothetical protein GUJ93_ZPchr0005g14278 [Zizania palustris]
MHRNPRLLLRAAGAGAGAGTLRALTRATPAPARVLLPRRPLFPGGHRRAFSSVDYGTDVDEMNREFAEAREDIEAAMESKETVYFDEEAACARDAAGEALAAFDALLARLPPADAGSLRRSMGLKMEQLKAELKQLDEKKKERGEKQRVPRRRRCASRGTQLNRSRVVLLPPAPCVSKPTLSYEAYKEARTRPDPVMQLQLGVTWKC